MGGRTYIPKAENKERFVENLVVMLLFRVTFIGPVLFVEFDANSFE